MIGRLTLAALCLSVGCKRELTPASPPGVTWAANVAAILDAKCVVCHREGRSGPFGLLEWDDVADHADQIAEVIRSGFMPPWKPKPGIGQFSNDRSLSKTDRETIQEWVRSGAKRGDPAERPPPPELNDAWQLGAPDLIVDIPTGYTLPAAGTDVYRNFTIQAPSPRPRWIRAWELRPTNPRVVHHAILNIDRTGWARLAEAADSEPGFGGMEVGQIQSPDGHYLVWTPGNTPSKNAGTAWLLDGRTDLVLQLHLQPSGKPEAVGARIGLYFAKSAPARRSFTLRIGDPPLDIPAGDPSYTISDRWTIPVAGELHSAFPHAHYLARRFEIGATGPNGVRRQLLVIEDWDFYWQDQYRFSPPVRLEAGTELDLTIVYDNSAANVRNPSSPPVRVKTGLSSRDEMGNVTFEFLPIRNEDGLALREAKYRRDIARGFGEARARYNLANVNRAQGRLEEAILGYQATLALVPDHFHALLNLAIALQEAGRLEEAAAMAERVLEVRPGDPGALTTLGSMARNAGRIDEAMTRFRAALASDPNYAPALNNLAAMAESRGHDAEAMALLERAASAGDRDAVLRVAGARHQNRDLPGAVRLLRRAVEDLPSDVEIRLALAGILFETGRAGDALPHLERAVELSPKHGMARYQLGGALSAAGRGAEARPHLIEAGRLLPEFAPVHNDLGVLAAMAGDMPGAVAHFGKAVALDPTNAQSKLNLEKARQALKQPPR